MVVRRKCAETGWSAERPPPGQTDVRREEEVDDSIHATSTPVPSATDSSTSPSSRLSLTQRRISLAEFVVGSAIVIGHNVYHVIPNEVPILFVIGLISLRVRDGGWGAIGLRWPVSWQRTVLFALAAAAVRILLGQFVTDPLTAHFWPPAVGPSGFSEITGHAMVALRWLFIVWTFAAFGEEISYRGYLITRAADVGSAISGGILGRGVDGVGALRLRTLLQRPVGSRGLRRGGPSARNRLSFVWTQPVGVHSGAWVHRYGWGGFFVLWMGELDPPAHPV